MPGAGLSQRQDFAQNLRRLCGEHRSVAEVCRRLDINRQQFNKYLAGTALPSAHSRARIAAFFAVDAEALDLPAPEFRARRRPPAAAIQGGGESARRLQRYLGYYHAYYMTPAYPGQILVALTALRAGADGVTDNMVERLQTHPRHRGPVVTCKYRGPVTLSEDRIFITHDRSLPHRVLGLSILYASQRARPHLLSGVFVSVSGSPGRPPYAGRLVYEHLGTQIDGRAALARCGLYPADSRAIDREIRARVKNRLAPGEDVLRALEY